MFTVAIDPSVFALEPEFRRGIVGVRIAVPARVDERLVAELRAAEAECREALDADGVANHPHLMAWRATFKKFGANPREFPPSVDALVRRVVKGGQVPSIHPLVDLGTIFSLRFVMPVGAHPVEEGRTLSLRATREGDAFQPPSGDPERPDAGEVVYASGNEVLTRRWAWRQSRSSLIQPTTLYAEFNLDALPPYGMVEVERAATGLMAALARYTDCRMEYQLLDASNPTGAFAV